MITQPVTLTQPRRRPALMALVGGLFVATGIGMVAGGLARGWLVVVFFAATTVTSLAQLVRPSTLLLDDRGMHITQLGKALPVWEWRHVDHFGVRKVARGSTFVGFSYDGPVRLGRRGTPESPRAGMLPSSFGVDPAALAEQLQARRDAAVAGPA